PTARTSGSCSDIRRIDNSKPAGTIRVHPGARMRYRRVTFRSTRLRTGQPWPFAGAWEHESLRLLLQARWRPAADMSETATAIEVTVDLAGVDEDDFEVQLFVQTPSAIRVIDDVMRGNRLLVFVAQRNDTAEPVTPESIHRVGTVGAIHQMARMPDGGVRAMVQGVERVRLLDFVAKDPYLVARIET